MLKLILDYRERFSSLSLLAAIVLACSACSGAVPRVPPVYTAESSFEAEAKRVIFVSFDGLRPDAIELTDTPHLHSMQVAGAYSNSAQTIVPSLTLPSHASMLSGVGPGKHGIDWNSYMPERGVISVPTVFDLARQKNLTTALVAGKEKFKHFQRPGTIDHFVVEEGSPLDVAKKAIAILKSAKPQIMFVHFRHPDSEGHSNGWLSSEQLAAISDSDQALGHLLVALKEMDCLKDTAVIATADHGGSSKGHGSAALEDTTIPWIATGAEIPVRGKLTGPITTYDTPATIADLLELDVPAEWDGVSVFAKNPQP